MFDILGIGDAIVDKIISFDKQDPLMQKILPVKGLFFVASEEEHTYLRNKPALAYYAGGSAANSIRNMALFGLKTGFVGKTGFDEEGAFFEKSLLDYGVDSLLLQTDEDKTGCSVVMVHEDKDRTQCARACAANLLQLSEVKDEYLENTRSVLLEGYMLNRRPDLVSALIKKAVALKKQVYFTLSDAHCVRNKRELLLELLPMIDVLFGNEFEFEELSISQKDLQKTMCVRTFGSKGVEVFTKNDSFFFETTPLTDIVNTNGAGDGFAGGFLAFYLKNESLETCVLMGQKVAQGVLNTDLSYLPNKIEF